MASSFSFEVLRSTAANAPRRGRCQTPHGSFETPAFAPCGTSGAIKGLLPEQVKATGVELILANSYHLALRPGSEVVREAGGLHRFMAWDGPILTDSGGYQVFSLAGKRSISDEGVRFAGPDSGEALYLDPGEALRIQRDLGSDIAMVLDECPPADASDKQLQKAHERTLLWARKAREIHESLGGVERGQALFGIVQGGRKQELRTDSAKELVRLDFDGYAIGGVSVGESKEEMRRVVAMCTPILPQEKIRYLMGVGHPDDLFHGVLEGIDLFDCVTPTRSGRNNLSFVPQGKLKIRNAKYREDFTALEEGCPCPACTQFTRAYLRHLALANEMLAGILQSLHNLSFLERLMASLRERIDEGRSESELREWFSLHYPGWAGS